MAAPSNTTIRYFGDYVLFGKIAEGAMGEVWFARQDSLNRPVAVKLIRAGALATPTEVERFRVEAQAAARLSHKNIVQVFEVGEHDGRHFFSMELIEGSSLASQIKEGAWRMDASNARERRHQAAQLVATIARAVHHAHQHGVLHRDIKPANILIDELHQPHLSDFGLAKLLDAASSLTASGAVLGTLSYMSPEQAQGKSAEATTAADIYSLGAVFYELLTGHPPFREDNWAELLRRIVEDEPSLPSRAAHVEHRAPFDRDLDAICLKCLEKSPSQRYASAEALADDLERWRRGEPIVARPASNWERARKWARRHPVTTALSAALAGALMVGLATTTWQWRRAVHQRSLTTAAYARLQLQRAEDFLASDNAYRALPLLARALRDNPHNRIAQERLVNALAHRRFLAPSEPPGKVSSADVQLSLRMARSPDGQRVATATNGEATAIQLWDPQTGRLLHSFAQAHSNIIRSVSFSPDGTRLISSSADASARIWNVQTPGLSRTLPHPTAVHTAEFSPDGQRVLTAGRDGVVRVWDPGNGELLLALPTADNPINVARFHPDGAMLCVGTDAGTVQLWSYVENRFQRFAEPLALSNAVWNLAFGSNFITATLDDGTIHTLAWTQPWRPLFLPSPSGSNTAVNEPSAVNRAPGPPQPITHVLGHAASQFHASPITATATSPDGRLLATASLDKTARVWDAHTLAPITEPLVHAAPVNCVQFSSDGLRVATSTPGNVARVWDAATGQPLTDWLEFQRPVAAVAFSNEGWLQTSFGEVWPIHRPSAIPPTWLPELAEGIGGVHLDEMGRARPAISFAAIRGRLTQSPDTNTIALWAKRLLGSPPP